MKRCETCRACLQACPTEAIRADRFLIKAERCLTYHNEEESEVSFPDWMDPAIHRCLVGCMSCQTTCPENRDVLDHIREGESFSSEETDLLIRGVALEQMPAETAEKLRREDLADLLELIPRNLKALLQRETPLPGKA
jgi:epoxyqueuosine reductase